MKTNKQLLLAAILILCGTFSANAQIPDEVTNVLRQCSKAMNNPNGLEYHMTIKAKMAMLPVCDGEITIATKGKKNKTVVSVSILGQDIKGEGGYDGENEWKYVEGLKGDTIYVTKTDKKSKGEYDINLELDSEYQKATMKSKNNYYEIDFTEPRDEEAPKKVTMKINNKNYYFREVRTSKSGATITMTLTTVKEGVPDETFILDPSRYPKAVVVRR